MERSLFSKKPPSLVNETDGNPQETVGHINAFTWSKEDLLTMLDNLPVGIILKDRECRYRYCNEAYARYLGLPKTRIIDSLDKDFLDEEVAQKVLDADRYILESNYARCKTIWNLGSAEAGDKWVTVRKRAILGEQGEAAYVLGVMEDTVSDNEAAIQMNLRDEELKRAIESEQKANRAKSDFVSNMSHEMRTPLNAIIGMTQIAQETRDPQKIEYCLEKISVASTALLSNINNILDISKIEAGKLELDHVVFSLEAAIKDVCSVISVRANEKRQILRISISPDIPENFTGDAVRLGQVFMNLLSNAVKYTPNEGKITLHVRLIGAGEKTSVIQASVKDTGVGMAPEQITRVFESYYQAEGGGALRNGGSGLGLSICKEVVELMKGGISVTSVPGEGSTFTFFVELENAKSLAAHTKQDGESLRILVGDPYMEEEAEYYNLLDGKNVDIVFVRTQAEILRMMETEAFARTPFDVIFFDFDIIKTNGTHIIQTLQQRFGRQKIVLVVAGTQFQEIEQQIDAGEVEKMLPRPLFASDVRKTLAELTGHALNQERKPDSACAGKRVLLAEDISDNAEVLEAFLKTRGIQMDWAQNGKIAVDMFTEAEGGYDLILMDLQMPVMNGYQATKRIRRWEKRKGGNTPIIAITASVFRDDLDRCLTAGMNDYITKPLDKRRALRKIETYLTQCKNDVDIHLEQFIDDESLLDEHADMDAPHLPIVDFSDGLDRVDGNAVLYIRLLDRFATGTRRQELENAWKHGSDESLIAIVHLLKGLAGNFSLKRLQYAMVAFEQELRAGKRSAHSYQRVSQCFDDTIEQIRTNTSYLKRRQTCE